MLQQLLIKNYALIQEVNIQFSPNMTIITGETGAGKSIILGALSLILGNRINKVALKNQTSKCIIEGKFDVSNYNLTAFFKTEPFDYEPITIIRREVTPAGKSRIFINDTPAKIATLKKLGSQLVSLHAQHQTLHLQDSQYHLLIVDTLAKHKQELTAYKQQFKSYQKDVSLIKKLEEENLQLKRDLDYILFRLNELEEAKLEDLDEQQVLEKSLHQLSNVEAIKTAVLASIYTIEEHDFSILKQLHNTKNQLASIVNFYPNFEETVKRLDSISIDLEDIRNDLSHVENNLLAEPERLEIIQERLTLLYQLQKKHLVDSIPELITIRDNLRLKSDSANNLEEEIEALKAKVIQTQNDLWKMANSLSEQRQKQFPILEKNVNELLSKVGMPHAKIKLKHAIATDKSGLTIDGIDTINLLFAANKGSLFESLKKVASGGELSRLMLCIQSLMAENMALPTLIFDEIDTGISGEVALKVGKVMQDLAQTHQIICITHLPQIASKGQNHLFVYKKTNQEQTITETKMLNPQNRVVEIAKMLSGDKPTKMALENAKELLEIN